MRLVAFALGRAGTFRTLVREIGLEPDPGRLARDRESMIFGHSWAVEHWRIARLVTTTSASMYCGVYLSRPVKLAGNLSICHTLQVAQRHR